MKKRKDYIDYIFIILLLLNGGTVLKAIGHTAYLQILTCLLMFFFNFKKW